jgi:hypothetical protein
MTDFEREVRAFILRAMNKAPGAVTDGWLRGVIKTAFHHIDFTAGDLGKHIASVETDNLISGTNDNTFGLMWALTPMGKITAQQLK